MWVEIVEIEIQNSWPGEHIWNLWELKNKKILPVKGVELLISKREGEQSLNHTVIISIWQSKYVLVMMDYVKTLAALSRPTGLDSTFGKNFN